jgi:hypothetical protein
MTEFRKLNCEWNADPNVPCPKVKIDGADVVLCFKMNYFEFTAFREGDVGVLRFLRCARYRLGSTNDEGWYRGQCRFSKIAPSWGEFYELSGDLRLNECPDDWVQIGEDGRACRHFLFYLRDETFECEAMDWEIVVTNAPSQR